MVLATTRSLSCPKCLSCPSPKQGNIADEGQLSAGSGTRRQSRLMSLVEASSNVVLGFVLAVGTQLIVFPIFGVAISVQDNLIIGSAFTVVSLLRSFLLRRLFESFAAR